MSKPKTKKRKTVTSGTNLTDAQRSANGWGRLNLRLKQTTLAKLAAIVEHSGYTRSEQIEAMIDLDYESLSPKKRS